MKILVTGLGKQEDMIDAFANVGDVVYYDVTKANGKFNQYVRGLVDSQKPDLLFMQIQTPGIIAGHTAKYIASKTKVVNWTGDVRHPIPQWFLDVGRHIHLTLFSNMNDVEQIRKYGIKADYLQIGFPTQIFKPECEAKENVPEIIFMGNNVGGFPLSGFRVDMVKNLKRRYGNRFAVYGINWGDESIHIPDQNEEASYYRGAKIGINLSHFNYSRYSSDRIFRLMGAGCFCLTHDYKDYGLEFENGKHLVAWSNFSDLFEKIDYYLKHEDQREQIAYDGCNHVHTNHTWEKRVEQLMTMI